MIPLILTLLAALPDRLPDGKTFDWLSFRFSRGVSGLGPNGTLVIPADGKLQYQYLSAPHTGSGGHVVEKKWEIPKAEVARLFRDLVDHGLFDLPEGQGKGQLNGANDFSIYSGRWSMNLTANPVPEKLLADLRPYLIAAHAEEWKEKPLANEKPVPTRFEYTLTEKAGAPETSLAIDRAGYVIYFRHDSSLPRGKQLLVSESWSIGRMEAVTLLESLLAEGLFDEPDTLGAVFPKHVVQMHAGKWRNTLYPKELPARAMKLLAPLLEKADPEIWKKK